jgi:hypothetical protein
MTPYYWHGGPTVRGDMLLPPSATGRCRSDPDDHAGGWVYITSTRSLAETYAATCRGWIYEVERERMAAVVRALDDRRWQLP